MNTKHTPGPWGEYFSGSHQQKVVIPSNGLGLVAILSEREDTDEIAANAQLIAAAPDLFKLVDVIHDLTQDDGSTRQDFIDLQGDLQKAIGRVIGDK